MTPAASRARTGLDRIARLSGLARASALVLGATLVWHAANFAFNLAAARGLARSDYGTLAAVVALLYIVSPLFFAVQTVASRITTGLVVKGQSDSLRGLVGFYGRRLTLLALVPAAALALASAAIAHALQFDSARPIVMLAATIPLAMTMYVQRGVLQGAERFGRFASSTFLEAGVKIVTAIVLLAWIWPTVEGAVAAILAALVAALVVNSTLLRFLPRRGGPQLRLPHPYRYSVTTLISMILLAVLLSADIVAAKHYLTPQLAGLYAAISLAGKIVFFATSGVNWVLFPRFSAMAEQGHDARPALTRALTVVLGVALVVTAVYFVAPSLVTGPLFGSRYAAAGAFIGWMAIGYGGYAVLYLMTFYMLASNLARSPALLAAAVSAQLIGFAAIHGSIAELISVQVTVLALTAASLVAVGLTANPHARRAGGLVQAASEP